MVVHSMQHSPKAARLSEILASHTNDPRLIQEAIHILKEAGSIEYAAKTAQRVIAEAWAQIEGKLPANQGTQELLALSNYLIQRGI